MMRPMSREKAQWKVVAHDPWVKLSENLWWVSGDVPGMSLKRTMTVARLQDGRLVIHNAIALDEAEMRELEALGSPAFLLVPSGVHRIDAPAYKARYPNLTVLTPLNARAKVQEVLEVDGTYDDFPRSEAVTLERIPGVDDKEGAMLVRSQDGLTVVLNDVVFNMDKKRDFLGHLFTTVLGSAPGPRVSRLAKLLLVKDRTSLREQLLRYAELPELVRLIVAHEKVATGAAAKTALQTAAGYL
jgi:hypothetical protein